MSKEFKHIKISSPDADTPEGQVMVKAEGFRVDAHMMKVVEQKTSEERYYLRVIMPDDTSDPMWFEATHNNNFEFMGKSEFTEMLDEVIAAGLAQAANKEKVDGNATA